MKIFRRGREQKAQAPLHPNFDDLWSHRRGPPQFADVLGPLNSPGGPNYVAPPTATPALATPQVGPNLSPDAPYDPDVPDEAQITGLNTALTLGEAKGIFATKDFLTTGAGMFGAPPPESDRSGFRQSIDAISAAYSKADGAGYGFAEGITETAVGLLGAGKVALLAKSGGLATAGISAVGMAAAFEPHAENFANLAQRIPSLNGPLTAFFASDPSDSTIVRIPTQSGHRFRFEAGHHSEMKPATRAG